MGLSYSEELDRNNIIKLRELLADLPYYCKDFFRGIEPRTESKTRIAYAYDLKVFFSYLLENNPSLKTKYKEIRDISLEVLDELSVSDIEEYMEFLKYRVGEDREVFNKELGIKRKISSLKSFYKYFYEKEALNNNPLAKVSLPKLREKEIIRLEVDEVVNFLNEVEMGERLTKAQKAYHEKNKLRDLALLTLMLGTGIRVSECVGINISDIDFNISGVRVHRKGGKEQTIYFGEEVEKALLDYLEIRKGQLACEGSEDALFLSLQMKRINVRSVENLVKKYASIVTPLKKITPHKLRSTYGTNLYRETDDIYLVASVLGHGDVNTTRKHYAALEDDKRRRARNAVKLREV